MMSWNGVVPVRTLFLPIDHGHRVSVELPHITDVSQSFVKQRRDGNVIHDQGIRLSSFGKIVRPAMRIIQPPDKLPIEWSRVYQDPSSVNFIRRINDCEDTDSFHSPRVSRFSRPAHFTDASQSPLK